jgi:large subunit ribosomal protein L9
MAATTKLILLEDVEDLGRAGDTVTVAPGHARNYLLPKGLAAKVTPGALRQLAARSERIAAKRKLDLEAAQALAAKVAEMEVTIPMQAGDDDRLFGSVTAHLIAEEMGRQGLAIESRRIRLEEPIKALGEFAVEIRLHAEVIATVKLWVVRA